MVPTNDVAPSTISCNNRVGFGVVSEDLIPSVLLIFREQVLLMRSCAVHLMPTDPALLMRHSFFGVPSAFFAGPLVQTHDPFQAVVITRSEYLGVVHNKVLRVSCERDEQFSFFQLLTSHMHQSDDNLLYIDQYLLPQDSCVSHLACRIMGVGVAVCIGVAGLGVIVSIVCGGLFCCWAYTFEYNKSATVII